MITLRHYGKKIEKLNLESINSQINAASKVIAERSGEGHEFMGWMDYCSKMTNDDIQDIIDSANLVRSKFDTLVCVGIGGSYLGGRAVIDAINGLKSSRPRYLLRRTIPAARVSRKGARLLSAR